MHPVDIHKAAIAAANAATFAKFGMHGPYTPGTEEHTFWLSILDSEMAKHYGRERV